MRDSDGASGRVIALIPARTGSKGIPGKNFKVLGDKPLYAHAIECAIAAGVERIIVSTDRVEFPSGMTRERYELTDGQRPWRRVADVWSLDYLPRPAALAQDDSPMYAVVKHAAESLQFAPDDALVILQPTQPFRKPEHVREAIRLLRETQADSVVSVVPVPLTSHPRFQCTIEPLGGLTPYDDIWSSRPTRRQQVEQTYRPDGTVYACRARTLDEYESIYGVVVQPLIIDPSDSCELDTEADWNAVERRWKERHD